MCIHSQMRAGLSQPQSASLKLGFSAEVKQASYNEHMSNSRPPLRSSLLFSLPNHFLNVAAKEFRPVTESYQPLTSVATGDKCLKIYSTGFNSLSSPEASLVTTLNGSWHCFLPESQH